MSLDAIGSVTRKMDGMRKQPYYYVLSLEDKSFFKALIKHSSIYFSGNGKGKPLLPLAELLITAHSTQHVETWLNSYYFQLLKSEQKTFLLLRLKTITTN